MRNPTFLPEDYLAQKADRRTDIICLTLFAVVMTGVLGAFLMTHRQRAEVKRARQAINAEYQQAATRISELTELQAQQEQVMYKAELTAALVERVPRSILLAEFVNRMPPRLSLLECVLKSEKVKPPKAEVSAAPRSLTKAKRGKTSAMVQAEKANEQVPPDRHRATVEMIGVAPTDLEVSSFITELTAHDLFRSVTLNFSEEIEVEGLLMRKFSVSLLIEPDADMREVQPLIRSRMRNPMAEDVQFGPGRAFNLSREQGD
ncbi:MAG: hypothetical protein KDA25_00210 [Phycisphaerales bacterium]|nr:hypothetical protein [Phycisphaerales bacterium]